jgi:hypothetical protein
VTGLENLERSTTNDRNKAISERMPHRAAISSINAKYGVAAA